MENRVKELVKYLNDTFGDANLSYSYTKGIKYFKLILHNYSSTSSYGFVDFQGNIYKADTWTKPAKYIRGHVDNPQDCCEKFSVKYLRR